jgi:hypothetical protein
MGPGEILLTLVISVPIVKFCIKRDSRANKITRRYWLWISLLISFSTLILPIGFKPASFYDKLRITTNADESTVVQQWRRMEQFRKDQVTRGVMSEEESEQAKKLYNMYKSVLVSPTNRYLYVKFGDILEYSPGVMPVEPNFMFVVAHASVFYIWVGAAIMALAFFLPQGGLLAISLVLASMFAVEMETRFIDADSIYAYMFFLSKSDWAPFELVQILRGMIVGIVNLVVVIAGVFVTSNRLNNTNTLLKNILRSNAAIVTAIKTAPSEGRVLVNDDDETDTMAASDIDIGAVMNKLIAVVSLGSFILFRNSAE